MRFFLEKRPLCFFVLLFTLFLILLEWMTTGYRRQNQLQQMNRNEEVVISGQLVQKETKNGHRIYYLKHCFLSAESASQFNKEQQNIEKELNGGGVICYLQEDVDHPIGRTIIIQGMLRSFSYAENEGQFDGVSYYGILGYQKALVRGHVMGEKEGIDILGETLFRLKESTRMFYEENMNLQDASILSAMLLGKKGQMDTEIKSMYQKNGIAHILAISGLHISLLGMGIYQALRKLFLPAGFCAVMGMGAIILYGKMVGGQSSVFRAICMFMLYLLAQLLSESYDMLTAMAVSALLLLVYNPLYLNSSGFWMSYLAVFGIGMVFPLALKRIQATAWYLYVPKWLQGLLHTLVASCSVQLVTLPVLLWFTYAFPPYSILLNLVVIPCLTIVLISGIVGAISKLWVTLVPASVVFTLYERLCVFFQKLPCHTLLIGRPSRWQIVLYYFCLFLWLLDLESFFIKEQEGRKRWHFLFRLCPLLLALIICLMPTRRIDAVDMLSVGQGDCICVRTRQGSCALVDGGSSSEEKVFSYRLLPYLKYNGIHRIDFIFLSHAHSDHTSAVIEAMNQAEEEGIDIGGVVLSQLAKGNQNYEEIRCAAEKAKVPIYYIQVGQQLKLDEVSFTCLYPAQKQVVSDENDESMVLAMRKGEFQMLFTGDLTQQAEGEVIRQLKQHGIEKIDCLKVAHHGAKTSTGEALLSCLKPRSALISCGRDNSYGHPHEETLQRLAQYGIKTYITKEQGQLRILLKKDGYKIQAF